MDSRLAEFRKLAEELKQSGSPSSVHYPPEVRAIAVEYAKDRVAQEGIWPVAKDLGVAGATLQKWLVGQEGKSGWRRVGVRRLPAGALPNKGEREMRAIVVLPSGVRIDLKSVLALLEALR
jgi:hypothetical protein